MVSVHSNSEIHALFYKNIVFDAQAEYSYISTDFRLKMFLWTDILRRICFIAGGLMAL